MSEPKRPGLRIVAPGEAPPSPDPAPAPVATPVPATQAGPSKGAAEFNAIINALNAMVPINAGCLVNAACYLSEAALGYYHQAVAHAPANTFRHDIPPGFRSAEATRAWLGTHLAALKAMAGGEVKPYDKANDLKQAAAMATTELDRATATAKSTGLWFEEREEHLFRDAMEDVALAENFGKNAVVLKQEPESDLYILGMDVLGGLS